MTETRSRLLAETALIYGRSSRVLDPLRLQVWDSLGIALPQLRILFRVRTKPGIDLRTLADELNISPSAASQQVDKLVDRGLLSRSPAESDRRRLRLELTELGTNATRAISRSSHAYLQAVLDILSDDDLNELHRLLDKIIHAAENVPAPHAFQPEDVEIEKSLRLR